MSSDEPLRVLHVLPHLEQGGTQRWVLELIEGTRSRGLSEHRVAVLGARDEMSTEFAQLPVVVTYLRATRGAYGWMRTLRILVREARSWKADVLLTHSRFDRPYGMLAGWASRTPVVTVLHSEFAASHYAQGDRASRASARDHVERALERHKLAGVIAVGPHLGPLWYGTGGPDGVAVHLAQPSVPDAAFARLARLPNGDEPLRVVTVGRLVASKRIDLVVRAMPLLGQGDRAVRLSIVGEGEQRVALEQLADQLDVDTRVSFLGNRADVLDVLAEHHVFVLPTRTEGLGKAILEAYAVGLAVCVPKLPSLDAIISNVERSSVIDDLSPAGVAAAIDRVVAVPNQLDAQARDRAWLTERLDEQKSLASTIQFLEVCARGHRRSAARA